MKEKIRAIKINIDETTKTLTRVRKSFMVYEISSIEEFIELQEEYPEELLYITLNSGIEFIIEGKYEIYDKILDEYIKNKNNNRYICNN